MTNDSAEKSLHLEEIVGDLQRVAELIEGHRQNRGGPIPFGRLEAELSEGLSLHLLDYISFLEAQQSIRYDRSRDELSPGEAIDEALESPAEFQEAVEFEFDKELVEGAGEAIPIEISEEDFDFGDDFSAEEDSIAVEVGDDQDDDLDAEVDAALEIDEEDIAEIDPDELEPQEEFELGDEDIEEAMSQEPMDEFEPADSAEEVLFDEESVEEVVVEESGGEEAFEADPVEPVDEIDEADPLEEIDEATDGEADREGSLDEATGGDADREDPLDESEESEESDESDESDDETDTTSPSSDTTSTTANSMNDRKSRNRRSSSSRSSSRSTSDKERYERIEEIGSGGIGTVYKGRHIPLDRDVAIKEISNVFDIFADLQREDIVNRFTEIIQTQARISHPAIIGVFDIDTDAEYPYVVTEYAPSGNLRRLIDNEEKRTLRMALKYFIQVLHGLRAAHAQDVVHGSIKPENVVLDATGNSKLCDFGLSTLIDLSGASNQVYVGVGAVAYMAPEQFQDPNAATVQSDIYALGIMFYEMLTGKVPGRRSPMPSSFYPEIPRKLDDIFDRMSMDEPEDRYQSVEAVLEDFYGADEIIDLLDRQSGVVFLRDPIEHGDEPLVHEGGGATAETTGGESAEPSVDATAQPDAGDSAGEEVSEEQDEETQETATDDETSPAEEADGEELDGQEDRDEAESAADEEDEEGDDAQSAEDVDGEEPTGDDEEDEVLDKLDEYGEMFEE